MKDLCSKKGSNTFGRNTSQYLRRFCCWNIQSWYQLGWGSSSSSYLYLYIHYYNYIKRSLFSCYQM